LLKYKNHQIFDCDVSKIMIAVVERGSKDGTHYAHPVT